MEVRFNTLRSFLIAAILLTGAVETLCAEDIEVDQILTDYSINPVNADLHYHQRDLRLNGIVVGIANEESRPGVVGQAELVSESGKHGSVTSGVNRLSISPSFAETTT